MKAFLTILLGIYAFTASFSGFAAKSINQKITLQNYVEQFDVNFKDNFKFDIPKAVQFIVSDKGLDKLETNIPAILAANGIDFSNFRIPEYKYETTIATEDFSKDPKVKEMIKKTIDALEKYLKDFEIKEHHFVAVLKDLYVKAKWEKITLDIRPIQVNFYELVPQNNRETILKGSFYLEAENIKLKLEDAKIKDLNNEFLGNLEVDGLEIATKSASANLKIKVPFELKSNSSGNPVFVVYKPESNFDKILLTLSYKKIILPKVSITINDKTFEVDQTEIEKDLARAQGSILEKIQVKLQEIFIKELPDILESSVNKALAKGFTQVEQMTPPGAPRSGPERQKLMVYGIKMSGIYGAKNLLMINLNGGTKDPYFPNFSPTIWNFPYAASRDYNPNNDKLRKADLSFAFNISFLNRFIEHGFQRGYYSKISFSPKDTIYIQETPKIKMDESGRLKMELKIESKVAGIQGWIVKKPLIVNFELFLKMVIKESFVNDGFENVNKKTVELRIAEIDLNSIRVNPNNFRWPFRKRGMKSVYEKLKKSNESAKDYVLTDNLPIPEGLLGLKIDINEVGLDQYGYLMFYCTIDRPE